MAQSTSIPTPSLHVKESSPGAYFLWEEAGRPEGMSDTFWARAEEEMYPPRLQGWIGSTTLDSGYFYAPYIPLTQTPVYLDGVEVTPGFRSLEDIHDDDESFFRHGL